MTYRKMVQNLLWATGYNVVAIPLAVGVLYRFGILLTPALGAAFMAASTVIVALNARFLRVVVSERGIAVSAMMSSAKTKDRDVGDSVPPW